MGYKKIIDLKTIVMSAIGFSLGFLFTNEIIGAIANAIDYAKDSVVPTFVSYFGDAGGTFGFLAVGGALLLVIAIIKRWDLLNVIEWIIIGAIVGILLPILLPIINDKWIEKFGTPLPFMPSVVYFSGCGVKEWLTKKLSKII